MIPNLRLKGPRLRSRLVSFVRESYVESSQQSVHKLNVTIRLPSHSLKEIEEDLYYKKRRQESDDEYDGINIDDRVSKEQTDEIDEEEDDIIKKYHVPKIRAKLEEEISELPSSEDELSSLDAELHQALASSTTTVSPIIKKEQKSPKPPPPAQPTRSLAGYRPLPINIKPIVEQELSEFNDEEFGTVDKIVFSLKDPLGGSKIKLPVKSCHCIHFECFDYENFCLFNKIPSGVQTLMKKELAKKSFKKLSDKKSRARKPIVPRNKITIINHVNIDKNPSYTLKFIKPQVPMYKCPLCDILFPLNDLLISDSFNYFVKSTPKDTERVELVEMNHYKIVDDTIRPKSSSAVSTEDIIILSDSEEDLDEDQSNNENRNNDHPNNHIDPLIKSPDYAEYDPTQLDSDNLLNDGLDDHFIQLPTISRPDYNGKGSWDDPVTLD